MHLFHSMSGGALINTTLIINTTNRIQWFGFIYFKYVNLFIGNRWGMDSTGQRAIGLGPQEEFYACADVRILSDHSVTAPPVTTTTPAPTTTTTSPWPVCYPNQAKASVPGMVGWCANTCPNTFCLNDCVCPFCVPATEELWGEMGDFCYNNCPAPHCADFCVCSGCVPLAIYADAQGVHEWCGGYGCPGPQCAEFCECPCSPHENYKDNDNIADFCFFNCPMTQCDQSCLCP